MAGGPALPWLPRLGLHLACLWCVARGAADAPSAGSWHRGSAESWCRLAAQTERLTNTRCNPHELTVPKSFGRPGGRVRICLHAPGEWLSDKARLGNSLLDCKESLDLWRHGPKVMAHRTAADISNSSLLVDVGANLGMCAFGILAVDPKATALLIEPLNYNIAQLAGTLCRNPPWASRVTLFQGAVGSRPGAAEMSGVVNSLSISRLGSMEKWAKNVPDLGELRGAQSLLNFHQVRVETLDRLLANATPARLLKIDVEGGELDVLLGASQLLGAGQLPLIVFEYDPQLMQGFKALPETLFTYLRGFPLELSFCPLDFLAQKKLCPNPITKFMESGPLGDRDLNTFAHLEGFRVHTNFVAMRHGRAQPPPEPIVDLGKRQCFLPWSTLYQPWTCCNNERFPPSRIWPYHPNFFKQCCKGVRCPPPAPPPAARASSS